jgi:potassium-transporting ATPase KdpC subunit
MTKHLRANLLLLGLTFVICSVLYPLSVLAIGQGLFPSKASGDIVVGPDGKPVGARLIAQEFKGDEWFQPRPSAVGYAANASGGSNYGANNPKLRERAEETLKARSEKTGVPADAVTASGSGLDPHITLKNAKGQLDRIVAAWAAKKSLDPIQVRNSVDAVLNEAVFEPLAGLAGGEAIVNVLEINLALNRNFNMKCHASGLKERCRIGIPDSTWPRWRCAYQRVQEPHLSLASNQHSMQFWRTRNKFLCNMTLSPN